MYKKKTFYFSSLLGGFLSGFFLSCSQFIFQWKKLQFFFHLEISVFHRNLCNNAQKGMLANCFYLNTYHFIHRLNAGNPNIKQSVKIEEKFNNHLSFQKTKYYIYHLFRNTNYIKMKGPGGSMSQVVGLPNNSYKPITNTAWVRARLCKLQNKVHSTRSRK